MNQEPSSTRRATTARGYEPPARDAAITLALDANEGPALPAAMAAALARDLVDPDLWRRYPDERPLRQWLASTCGVPFAGTALGAGADELLDRACRTYLPAGATLVAPTPCFAMLRQYVAAAGGTLHGVPWLGGPLPVDALVAAVQRTAAPVLAITSPNNPTGLAATTAELTTLAAALPKTLLLVDLAYVEFADSDPTAALLRSGNVLVLRTASKAHGLAGLRVGYALGTPDVVTPLRGAAGPFPCSSLSLRLCLRVLARGGNPAGVAAVRAERAPLAAALQALGFAALPSQANFVFATGRPAAASWLVQNLRAQGIGIRSFRSDDPQLAGAVRITCPGNAADFARLGQALAAARSQHTAAADGGGA